MRIKKVDFTLILLLILTKYSAIAQFSLSGEFRPRTEYRDGFNYKYENTGGNTSGRKGTSGYIRTDARVTLDALYTTESYTAFMKIQEVFIFGDRQQISTEGNGNFRMQEAWADIKLSKSTRFKIGRQPVSYDDQRILGGLGWAQQARTHDLGILKHNNKGYSIDLGFAYNGDGKDNIYDTSAFFSYQSMAFLRVNKKYNNFNISALALSNSFQDQIISQASVNLFTGGIHIDYTTNKFIFSANGFIQNGERIEEIEVDGAFLTGLDIQYNATEKTVFGLGGEIISGNTDTSVGFFPLYGTNHKFNGLMDRFYVGNYANGNGLIDINISIKTHIFKTYQASVKGHVFKEQSQSKNNLGQEVDFVLSKNFNGYSLQAGYSQFFESDEYPNPSLNPEAKNTQNWAWLMLTIKPNFL